MYTVWVKTFFPEVFWKYFPNDCEFLNEILHAYCLFLYTLYYKICLLYTSDAADE